MSDSLNKKLEKILQLLERLAGESAKGVPIVVEGQNDITALHELDIEGDIIVVKSSGKSFVNILTEMEGRQCAHARNEIILLLDFDRQGTEWTKRIVQHLERSHLKPNTFFWRGLRSIVGRDVKDVEGLAGYLKTLRKKCGGWIRKV